MKKSDLFRIGEVSIMFNLSVSSLRHYEKTGLLKPEYIDPQSGYRYYSTRQFECLNTIRYLRALDMSLEQIADFLNNRDIDKIKKLLYQQKEEVIQKQKEYRIIEQKINNRLRQLEDALTSEFETIRLIHKEKTRLAMISNHLSLHSYLDLETSIRQLENNQKEANVFLGKVGVGITQENLIQQHFDSYDLVFLILEKEDSYQGTVIELPKETCLSIRFCGSHQEAPKYYQKLNDYILKNSLQITGFSKEITLIDYGITHDTRQFVTEIQIPVSTNKDSSPK